MMDLADCGDGYYLGLDVLRHRNQLQPAIINLATKAVFFRWMDGSADIVRIDDVGYYGGSLQHPHSGSTLRRGRHLEGSLNHTLTGRIDSCSRRRQINRAPDP